MRKRRQLNLNSFAAVLILLLTIAIAVLHCAKERELESWECNELENTQHCVRVK